MKLIKNVLISSVVITSLQAEGCWSALELSQYAQDSLSDVQTLSFKDVITCEPLAHVSVNFLGKEFTSNKKGLLQLPTPPENIDAEVPISITKKGYIPIKQTIPVSFGSYWKTLFSLSKDIPVDAARFVLSWGAKPNDLDIHLKSKTFHISFRNIKSIANKVKLDRDAMKGYGPETITLDKIDKNENYKVLIYRYSTNGKIDKKSSVSIYLNKKFDKTLYMPSSNVRCLEVAQINNAKVTYNIIEHDDKECH